jgi:hypothetical protein
MTRRPAVTLIEAMMAIFVMAIGLLALLTLFPLGALSMAQALKDQRTAEAAINATAQFKALGLGTDQNVTGVGTGNPVRAIDNSYFENPWPPPANQQAIPPNGLPAINAGSAFTYPVYIDPPGVSAGMGSTVGGLNQGGNIYPGSPAFIGIPRVSVSPVPANGATAWLSRHFTLQDDLTFQTNGTADVSPGYVQREGRYTWAYMVRRVRTGVSPPEVPLDITVVVYAGRSPGPPVGVPNPPGEYAYTNTSFTPARNLVSINYGANGDPKPALRRGTWVLDARMLDAQNNPAPQGYFYRVVNVNEVSAGVIEAEVQTPLGGPLRNPPNMTKPGPLVVMESVSEVFEKGTSY